MGKKIVVILLLSIFLFSSVSAAQRELFINSFWAIESSSDRSLAPYADQVSLGWAEVRMNEARDGAIFSTKRYGDYIYGIPGGVADLVKELKDNENTLMLSIFSAPMTVRLADGSSNTYYPQEILLRDDELQDDIISQIVENLTILDRDGKVVTYKGKPAEYDGIVIDFEELIDNKDGISYKEKFNQFLSKLKNALPENKKLSVCVHPKRKSPIRYYDAYDYKYIGQIADEVILMAHDYHDRRNFSIMASAPLPLVNEALDFALKEIPKEKILLGISIAPVQYSTSPSQSFFSPSYQMINNAISGKNGEVISVTPEIERFDVENRLGYIHLVREGDREDHFYFENERSILEKKNLALSKGIKGISVWRLGLGEASVNNGIYFKDIYRIFGPNRYETAVNVSQSGWEKSDAVILASGVSYPDALAGSTFGFLKDAPMLLTSPNTLSGATKREIERLEAKTVYILGGQAAVSQQVQDALTEMKLNTIRISGDNRFETAIKLGEEVRKGKKSDTVIIATGFNYPDALSIAPFAAMESMPILFTQVNSLHSSTKAALEKWGTKNVIIVGGDAAVSEEVKNTISKMGISVNRLSSNNRYSTSVEIAKHFESLGFSDFYIATGENFADALTGSILAAKNNAPILLTGSSKLSTPAAEYLRVVKPENIHILGGNTAISQQVRNEVFQAAYIK